MDEARRRALEILARASRSTPRELAYRLEHYLEAAARLERLPRNQSGQDKSWVWRLEEADREYFARVRPIDDSE